MSQPQPAVAARRGYHLLHQLAGLPSELGADEAGLLVWFGGGDPEIITWTDVLRAEQAPNGVVRIYTRRTDFTLGRGFDGREALVEHIRRRTRVLRRMKGVPSELADADLARWLGITADETLEYVTPPAWQWSVAGMAAGIALLVGVNASWDPGWSLLATLVAFAVAMAVARPTTVTASTQGLRVEAPLRDWRVDWSDVTGLTAGETTTYTVRTRAGNFRLPAETGGPAGRILNTIRHAIASNEHGQELPAGPAKRWAHVPRGAVSLAAPTAADDAERGVSTAEPRACDPDRAAVD